MFITGADNRIISLCFITLQNCACAQPAYFRPPFCGGSNGFFRRFERLFRRFERLFRRFERLFRRFESVSLHRNKKTPVGRFFISGADNRAPALGNKLPNFVLFATARSPLVSSRLRVACLDYSYANRGSNPYPCTEIKKRPLGDFLFLGRITGFEPATPGTTNQCSNQLSYIRHTETWWS